MSSQPGIYDDLTNDDYHAETDWLSSTQLKGYLPEHFKTGGNPEAFAFGNLVHTAVLEPDLLSNYVALDAATIGVKSDGTPAQVPTMTVAWKRAVVEVEQDGKTVVDQADMDRALAMRDAILTHDTAKRLLYDEDGRNELSVFAVDENGVQHKARFDRLIAGAGVDLKTTSAMPGEDALTKAVLSYGYHLSAAHYLEVARLAGIEAQAFALVFVAKTEPYRVTVCDLDAAFIDLGRQLRDQAIARHLHAAPAYEGATGFLTLTPPAWATRKAVA